MSRLRIFLCYRRDDTRWVAGWLGDELRRQYGPEQVFQDIRAARPGIRYTDQIKEEISRCDVLVVLMGESWLSAADSQGRRRLDSPRDLVRLEIAAALQRGIPIIPVLVQRTSMPTEVELPDDIADLTLYHACEVSDTRWDYDVDVLLKAINSFARPSVSGETSAVGRQTPVQRPRARVPKEPTLPLLAVGKEAVDVAIVTVLAEEYQAVRKHMKLHARVLHTKQRPNIHSWIVGEIDSPDYAIPYRVVLALAHHAGTTAGASVVKNTIEAFDPLYVLLVGVAEGLGPVEKGDVVVSDRIWGYDFGKLDARFRPRPDWNFPADGAIVSAARSFRAQDPNWSRLIDESAPRPNETPTIVIGPVASGEKIVDDISDDFFQHVVSSWPQLRAVETEGVGAATAILDAREQDERVGFAMVRGISGTPRSGVENWEQSIDGSTLQAQERDAWRKYAADAAAVLAVQLIGLSWPRPPRSKERE